MEFRFRSVDVDRPFSTTDTTLSNPRNLTVSFKSGCNIRPVEDHVREALQRKIEKEQIRQQIIVAKTTTRREVSAEVVHETTIEREMAIKKVLEMRGMPEEENLTSPMSEATSTSTLESNNEKLIILNRIDFQDEDTQAGFERSKRKGDGVETILNESSRCKRLKLKTRVAETNWMSAKRTTVETGETISQKLPYLGGFGSSGKQEENKKESKYKFWCEDCGVGASSETAMRNHKLGKKHMTIITPP